MKKFTSGSFDIYVGYRLVSVLDCIRFPMDGYDYGLKLGLYGLYIGVGIPSMGR